MLPEKEKNIYFDSLGIGGATVKSDSGTRLYNIERSEVVNTDATFIISVPGTGSF